MLAVFIILCFVSCTLIQIEGLTKQPTVLVSINSRNDEHLLPTFLGHLEKLNYPKKRISLLIQTDHNEDDTFNILSTWISNVRHLYHRVQLKHEEEPTIYPDARNPNDFSEQRYLKLLQLRQNAFQEAKNQWADYLMFIDADNFLHETDTIEILMNENKTIISPLLTVLQSVHSKSLYSNFWAGVDFNGYYKRVPLYSIILNREEIGTFSVPMVHSTILIDMKHVQTDVIQLYPVFSYYNGHIDDLLVFSFAAQEAGIKFYICNKVYFGYLLPPSDNLKTLHERRMLFKNAILEAMADTPGLSILRSENVPHRFPKPTYAGFDEIFVINLQRRTDRFRHMKNSLRELGLRWKHFEAIDGKNLTQKMLDDMGIKPMTEFRDEYFKRNITHGEIGCFLSHYYIWQEMVERKLESVLILEDDARFLPDFREKLDKVMNVANTLNMNPAQDWDFLYIGRKVTKHHEQFVEDTEELLVYPKFSLWTIAYVLRLSGAKKLLAGDPLGHLIPVNDYLLIKYGRHSDKPLMSKFAPRDLKALSVEPLLIEPAHHPYDSAYVSDTEETDSIDGQDNSKNFQNYKLKEQETSGKSTRSGL